MLKVYRRQESTIQSQEMDLSAAIPVGALWIDILNPTDADLEGIEQQLGIEIPTKNEVWKNQVLNRQYVQDNIAYMAAAIITKIGTPYPDTSAVTFILSPKYLLTVRHINPTSFQNFGQRIQLPTEHFTNSTEVLEGLLEEIITRIAYNSEVVVQTLDEISHQIFCDAVLAEGGRSPSHLMKEILRRLGTAADLNSKINESLHSVSRMLSFFRQIAPHHAEQDHNIDILITDAKALTNQCAFLSDKITFQLDALLGMINVEQNLIIKIFSVVTVFFLPPTLVSSLYGMNFHHMPELEWAMGYPLALMLMGLCAVIPYLYFRKKGWL